MIEFVGNFSGNDIAEAPRDHEQQNNEEDRKTKYVANEDMDTDTL